MVFIFLMLLALPDIPDEDRLLARARQGNRKAITSIYEAYFDAVYNFIRWRVNDPTTAEDLTSEVFIKLLNALQSPQAPQHSLRGWLFRVARNVLADHYRYATDTSELDDTMAAPDDPEAQLVQMMDAERVRQAIGTLAPPQQEVLILRFGQMMSVQDTSAIMEKSVSAIKSLQFRAINALRDALREPAMGVEHGAS